MNVREETARRLFVDPANSEAAQSWVAASYLLSQTDSCLSAAREVPPSELLLASEEIISLDNKLEALKNDSLQILSNGAFVSTEKDALTDLPGSVVDGISAEIGRLWMALDPWEKAFGSEMLFPVREAIVSERLSRTLRSVFHRRLVPELRNSADSGTFSEICLNLAAFVSFDLGSTFRTEKGILPVRDDTFDFMKMELGERFDKARVAWFFELMKKTMASKFEGLGHSALIRDSSRHITYMPYHTLCMLSTCIRTHAKSKDFGKARNYKGSAIEDVMFNAITAYLQTVHPRNGRKLRRYPLPDSMGDVDVAGFDAKNLLLIEAKFWNSPTVGDLEEELDKFKRRFDYVQKNLAKLGFDNSLKVIPIFFTPYAPFPKFHEILLLPSFSAVLFFLQTKFDPRQFRLIEGDERINKFVQTDHGEHLDAYDGSWVSGDIRENTYRIQDGVVDSFVSDEITVYVMGPSGNTYTIICELNETIASQLRDSGVGPGTVIRMGLYNLLGGWAPTQLCFFRVVKNSGDTQGLTPRMMLTLANASSAQRGFVIGTWGIKLGNEILAFIDRWKIDLPSLLARLDQKGQNYLSGLGAALGLQNMWDHLAQCGCGDVFATSKELATQLSKTYADGKLRCRSCDPELETKIRTLSGEGGRFISYREFAESASSQVKTGGDAP